MDVRSQYKTANIEISQKFSDNGESHQQMKSVHVDLRGKSKFVNARHKNRGEAKQRRDKQSRSKARRSSQQSNGEQSVPKSKKAIRTTKEESNINDGMLGSISEFEKKKDEANKTLIDESMDFGQPNILIKSQISQRSYDNFKNNDEQRKELEKSAAKKLPKVESQMLEKSCTKEKFAGSRLQRSALKSSVKSIIKSIRRDTLESHRDGHKISMDDCEPSPQKDKYNYRDSRSDQNNSQTEPNQLDQVLETQNNGNQLDQLETENNVNHLDLRFSGDNSSIVIHYNDTKNLDVGKLNNISYDESDKESKIISNHPYLPFNGKQDESINQNNRVPQLQFNGIGFSFNERNNNNRMRSSKNNRQFNLSHSNGSQAGYMLSPSNNSSKAAQIKTKVVHDGGSG